ncbi:amidohydrolase [Bordetella genomosp. 5]|uniref:amidohydrolase family protein n=1 Tax=Bordetella genomosp. 5 TaxID=1395608 RepID=UPI000B9E936B|nr:amidohydrolase family protein [Bordetella genomosp. 5]OZI44864.1 amidohydrolase [Bordetella genomosp. 5]
MPDCPPPLSHPSVPVSRLPAGACDTHCHVFGPAERFPYAAGRSYTPPDAPFEKLAALHAHLGLERAVIVQAACHGADHAALLDAIAHAEGRYRGVAVLRADATDDELRRLHAGGVRGARFNYVPHLGAPPTDDAVLALAARLAPLGWHLCLHVDGAALTGLLPLLRRLPVPFVVDHMGRIEAARGLTDPAFTALLGLAAQPNAWVKISGIDRIGAGKRPFHQGLPFMRALAEAMPERTLWGTDWPHPNVRGDMPDDGEVVDALFEAVPDAGLRQSILVDNPARLYGFDAR